MKIERAPANTEDRISDMKIRKYESASPLFCCSLKYIRCITAKAVANNGAAKTFALNSATLHCAEPKYWNAATVKASATPTGIKYVTKFKLFLPVVKKTVDTTMQAMLVNHISKPAASLGLISPSTFANNTNKIFISGYCRHNSMKVE